MVATCNFSTITNKINTFKNLLETTLDIIEDNKNNIDVIFEEEQENINITQDYLNSLNNKINNYNDDDGSVMVMDEEIGDISNVNVEFEEMTQHSAEDSQQRLIGKNRKGKENSLIDIYNFKVHPNIDVSHKSMLILNDFINDMFEKISSEASKLAAYNKRSTITSHDIQYAIKLILPGELARNAIFEGVKAVDRYNICNSSYIL
ncbi:3934_t:CDS:2 [Entrophospora sp. SA101]|nr:3934_t:CDS:2 [Entrophospora sp. SA101]